MDSVRRHQAPQYGADLLHPPVYLSLVLLRKAPDACPACSSACGDQLLLLLLLYPRLPSVEAWVYLGPVEGIGGKRCVPPLPVVVSGSRGITGF